MPTRAGCNLPRLHLVGHRRLLRSRIAISPKLPAAAFFINGHLEQDGEFSWQRFNRKKGYADTSLQDLERATGVNKSGLYAEFRDKDDLFTESLKFYLEQADTDALLSAPPLGLDNIEWFLALADSLEAKKSPGACSDQAS
jgi:hypothetical protein